MKNAILALAVCAAMGFAATVGSSGEKDPGPDLHVLRAENAMLKRLVMRLQKELAALRAQNRLLKAALPDSGSPTSQKSRAPDADKGVQTFVEGQPEYPFREPIKIGAIGYIGKAKIEQVIDKANALVKITLSNLVAVPKSRHVGPGQGRVISRDLIDIRGLGNMGNKPQREFKTLLVYLAGISTHGWTDGAEVQANRHFKVIGTKQYATAIGTTRTVFQLTPRIRAKLPAPPDKPPLPAVKLKPPPPGPSDMTVYITRTGRKYHRGSCRHLRRSRIPIKLKDAKARGHGPCSVCRPP